MQYYRLLRFLVFPLAVLLPVTSFGTSIVRLSLEQTVAQAEWIVEGDVVRNWCGWDSGHRFIWTHTEIAVRNRWKGAAGNTITVSEPGGMVNGMGLEVAGMVRYAAGEHVVVFLYRTPIGLIRTVGLAQGKLQVDTRGRVHPESAMAPLASPAGVRATGTSVGELEAVSLSEAHDRIMRLAATATEVRK
jgi:hypothetical protein